MAISSSVSFASTSYVGELEAAFLAGVALGQKGELKVADFSPADGYVTVEKKGEKFEVYVYNGYDCAAEEVTVDGTDSVTPQVTGAEIFCH